MSEDSNATRVPGVECLECLWGCAGARLIRKQHQRSDSRGLRRRTGAHAPFGSCQNRSINIGPRPGRLFRDTPIPRRFTQQYVVLFVVLLFAVIQALNSGCQSRASGRVQALLPRAGPSRPFPSNRTEAQPGRHDFIRIQCASLANDRGWPTLHGLHASSGLRCIRGSDGTPRRGARPEHPKAQEGIAEDSASPSSNNSTPLTPPSTSLVSEIFTSQPIGSEGPKLDCGPQVLPDSHFFGRRCSAGRLRFSRVSPVKRLALIRTSFGSSCFRSH